MKNFLFKDRDGQTPLPEELQKGLIPKNVQTIGELDEYEEENITEGLRWLANAKENDLTYSFWLDLHKHLFRNVWKWAGKVRQHELSHPDFYMPGKIWPALKQLEDDAQFWFENESFPSKEIAARFHERIEIIHPFANGNGRFGRILTEHICEQRGLVIPTWGKSMQDEPQKRRKTYVNALYTGQHDQNYEPLVEFMFS